MADNNFPFGQYRRLSNILYVHEITPKISDSNVHLYSNGSSDSEGIVFTDKLIQFNNVLNTSTYYVLKVKIDRLETTQRFNIYLQNTDNKDEVSLSSQFVGYYEIPPIMTSDKGQSSLLLIIKANELYPFLIFELLRTIKDDYKKYERKDGTIGVGREPEIHPYYFGYLNNINKTGKSLVKIGIQATPGMLFCINGLGIRIGPSGLYLINNGYEVDFIGTVLKESTNLNSITTDPLNFYDYEYFTIDYRYKVL